MSATEILQGITLAVSGWSLIELIKLKELIARHDQALTDLPCGKCEYKKI